MGMFDTFIVKEVTCPHCGTVHEDFPVQSKYFDCFLITYQEGDIVSDKIKEVEFTCRLYRCPRCEEDMGDIDLYLSKGVFTGTKQMFNDEIDKLLMQRLKFMTEESDRMNSLIWDIRKAVALKKNGKVKRSQLHYIPSVFEEDEFNDKDMIDIVETLLEEYEYELLN